MKNGIYDDLAEPDYHGATDALSASGAKLLLPPSCPAKFRHRMDNPIHSDAFDLGHVAHRLVLGKGEEFVVIEADSWRTKDARDARIAARANGMTPILQADYETAQRMALAVKEHAVAGSLFTDGKPEVSAFWTDGETGIQRRARFDCLRNPIEGRRRIIADLKTARSAEPVEFGRAAANYGYAIQAANYVEAAQALGMDDDPAFIFCVVEKEEPHVVTVAQLDDEAIRVGRALLRRALDIFATCRERDEWPGYATDVARLSLPPWFINNTDDYLASQEPV